MSRSRGRRHITSCIHPVCREVELMLKLSLLLLTSLERGALVCQAGTLRGDVSGRSSSSSFERRLPTYLSTALASGITTDTPQGLES